MTKARHGHSGMHTFHIGAGLTPDSAEWANHRKSIGNAKFLRDRDRALAYLNSQHDYYLVIGDAPGGEERSMTGHEAKTLNKDFEDQFFAGKCKRLSRWKLQRERVIDQEFIDAVRRTKLKRS